MPSLCPTSARVSLPNALQSLFKAELAPQLHSSSIQQFNQPSLPRHHLISRRAISSVPTKEIPIASAEKPERQEITEDEFSIPNDPPRTSASSRKSSGNFSARDKTNSARSPFPRESKHESKPTHNTRSDRPKRDRDGKKPDHKGKHKAPYKPKPMAAWGVQKEALNKKFPSGWAPLKKLSPDAMDSIRHLHHVSPDQFTTAVLAEEFKVSPEAIRRILKSRWRPTEEETEKRRIRWEKRHDGIWNHLSEMGLRPKLGYGVRDAAEVLYGHKKNKPPGPPGDDSNSS